MDQSYNSATLSIRQANMMGMPRTRPHMQYISKWRTMPQTPHTRLDPPPLVCHAILPKPSGGNTGTSPIRTPLGRLIGSQNAARTCLIKMGDTLRRKGLPWYTLLIPLLLLKNPPVGTMSRVV